MPSLFKEESSHAKWNAQRNLQGRTHYVDDDTLRWHKSRILHTRITDDGLIFALIESCAADMDNTKRGFRYVLFDVFGNVVRTRAKLDDLWSSSAKAMKEMWKELNTIDAKAITLYAVRNAEKWHAYEMTKVREQVQKIYEKEVSDNAATTS